MTMMIVIIITIIAVDVLWGACVARVVDGLQLRLDEPDGIVAEVIVLGRRVGQGRRGVVCTSLTAARARLSEHCSRDQPASAARTRTRAL